VTQKRVGIFGGTFDPPHVGHLLVALDALDLLALDRVVFVPAATQPLKESQPSEASSAHRLAMTELMIGDEPSLVVDPIEVVRGGLSFTVDTLRTMADRSPDDERVLLVGSDVASTLAQWREPEEIKRLANVTVIPRGRRIDVSSTEIRARVREGRSIRGFVTDSVRVYIETHGLYRQG
jgi:nicotinate-nucleotide adenylyltransferase